MATPEQRIVEENPRVPESPQGTQTGVVTQRRTRASLTLFRYLAQGILLNALVALIAFVAILGIVATVRATEEFQMPVVIILQVLVKAFGAQLIYALPVALLFGAGILVGRLHADREVMALKSFGISSAQLLLPACVVGLVFCAISYYLNQSVVPRFRFAIRNVEALILDNISGLGEGWNQQFQFGSQPIWIYHHDGAYLEGIFFELDQDDEAARRMVPAERLQGIEATAFPISVWADRGEILSEEHNGEERVAVRLYGVSVLLHGDILRKKRRPPPEPVSGDAAPGAREEEQSAGRYLDRFDFALFTYYPPSPDKDPGLKDRTRKYLLEEIERRRSSVEMLRGNENSEVWQRAKRRYDEAVAVGHRRLAWSLCVLMFPVAGFALGLRVRSGNRLLPFFVTSTVIPVVYFVLVPFGDGLAESGVLPAITSQLGNIALAALALVCTSWEHWSGGG